MAGTLGHPLMPSLSSPGERCKEMADRSDERPDGLSDEELAEAGGEVLPDREAMSVISSDVTIPVDPAVAASVLAGDGGEAEQAPAVPELDEDDEGESEGG